MSVPRGKCKAPDGAPPCHPQQHSRTRYSTKSIHICTDVQLLCGLCARKHLLVVHKEGVPACRLQCVPEAVGDTPGPTLSWTWTRPRRPECRRTAPACSAPGAPAARPRRASSGRNRLSRCWWLRPARKEPRPTETIRVPWAARGRAAEGERGHTVDNAPVFEPVINDDTVHGRTHQTVDPLISRSTNLGAPRDRACRNCNDATGNL